jgi:hypothetical protein
MHRGGEGKGKGGTTLYSTKKKTKKTSLCKDFLATVRNGGNEK